MNGLRKRKKLECRSIAYVDASGSHIASNYYVKPLKFRSPNTQEALVKKIDHFFKLHSISILPCAAKDNLYQFLCTNGVVVNKIEPLFKRLHQYKFCVCVCVFEVALKINETVLLSGKNHCHNGRSIE